MKLAEAEKPLAWQRGTFRPTGRPQVAVGEAYSPYPGLLVARFFYERESVDEDVGAAGNLPQRKY